MNRNERPRILAIDDDADIRTLLEAALSDSFEVFTAMDAVEGLSRFAGTEPDLVILDIMMPGMDGWAVLDQIRHGSIHSDVPVILLTAQNERDSMKRGYQEGANVYLTKPFETERLRKNVTLTLSGRPIRVKRHSAVELVQMFSNTTPVPGYRSGINDTPLPNDTPFPTRTASSGSGEFRRFRENTPLDVTPIDARGGIARIGTPTIGRPGAGRVPVIPSERPRVLIAIADAETAEILRTLLESMCDVFQLRDGADARPIITDVEPDLLVIGSHLPHTSGYQLVDWLQITPELADVPVIFVTDKDFYRERLTMAGRGVSHVIGRPIRPYEFTNIAREIIGNRTFVIRPKTTSLVELARTGGHRRPTAETRAAAQVTAREAAKK